MTITEFLKARVAEDKQAADVLTDAYADPALAVPASVISAGVLASSSRLLAESDAKSMILARHIERPGMVLHRESQVDRCGACRDHHWPCATLRAIASVYADHPDFDPAWRVDG